MTLRRLEGLAPGVPIVPQIVQPAAQFLTMMRRPATWLRS
jgi:hypothetical protein